MHLHTYTHIHTHTPWTVSHSHININALLIAISQLLTHIQTYFSSHSIHYLFLFVSKFVFQLEPLLFLNFLVFQCAHLSMHTYTPHTSTRIHLQLLSHVCCLCKVVFLCSGNFITNRSLLAFCTFRHIHAHAHAHAHTHTHTCAHTHTCTCMHTHTGVMLQSQTCAYAHIKMALAVMHQTHARTHAHTHAHTHTHVHTPTHAHEHTQESCFNHKHVHMHT